MDVKIRFNHNKRFRPWPAFAAAGVLTTALLAGCGERAETHYEQARHYEKNLEYEKAARYYELVAQGFKRSPLAAPAAESLARCRAELHFDRAEDLIYDGATYTALDELAAGRRLAPDLPRGLYVACIAHLQMGPRDVALEEANDCVKRFPESPYGYLGRAEYSRFGARREDALEDYIRGYRAAGSDARCRGVAYRGIRDMAWKLELPGDYASSLWTEGLASVPAGPLNYWTGYYYLAKKPYYYDAAIAYFRATLAADTTRIYRGRANAALARAFVAKKDFKAARGYIDAALVLDAENDEFFAIADEVYKRLDLPPPRKGQAKPLPGAAG